jgi:hypothetical protein
VAVAEWLYRRFEVAVLFLAGIVATALDPPLLFGGGALAYFLTRFLPNFRLRHVLLTLALGSGAGVIHWMVASSMPQLPTAFFYEEPSLDVYKSNEGTKYEGHFKEFLEVRNTVALDWMRRRIDQKEKDCLILVGSGPNLFSRCSTHQAVVSIVAANLVISVTLLAFAVIRGRRVQHSIAAGSPRSSATNRRCIGIGLKNMASILRNRASLAAAPLDNEANAAKRGNFADEGVASRSLADTGDAAAQFGLGIIYFNGEGVPQDDVAAATWWRKAADQGYDNAQLNLGIMYFFGRGVPQDHSAAVRWLRKAADQGRGDAQSLLGAMYASGHGVPQDYVSAHMWFNLSAAAGEKDAARERNVVAAKMTPAQIAEAQRLAREWKPTTASR